MYSLAARNRGDAYYNARTDRNIGWITRGEQELLRGSCVAIAGAGGMGGLIAQMMVRLGIGEIRIADPESFELSNMNRQAACKRETIGCSKAIQTEKLLRTITDDYALTVYPEGIMSDTVESFVRDADVIIDEIEFWNIGSCIRMHQAARRLRVPVFNCLTVGFATYLHVFTPHSVPVEKMLRMSLQEAEALERSVLDGTITSSERERLAAAILDCFIPSFPCYYAGSEGDERNAYVKERLCKEGVASIIATNPPVAAGILANQVLLYLLVARGVVRSVLPMPVSPGYAFFDSARFETKMIIKRGKET